ncbi:MAG: tetratricopeptide repeat-containing serine/threonine-protein kinase [Planctomycetota bacterium]|mgnify:CR=1 FL=1
MIWHTQSADGGEVGEAGRSAERRLIEAASATASQFALAREGTSGGRPFLAGYDQLTEVARGGQGVVYRAVQADTGREVAIKVVVSPSSSCPHHRARFDREVRILGRLRHPNIVPIHGVGDVDGHRYFVMDYVRGEPLDAYLAGRGHSVGDVLRLFAKICEAVQAAHAAGVIHRDLKPGNIRVDARGEPHVLDFGLAKMAMGVGQVNEECVHYSSCPECETCRDQTQSGQFLGSLPWASPEQVLGTMSEIDARSDVYSLGVLLHSMLTGELPYPVGQNMRDAIHGILDVEPTRPSAVRRGLDHDLDAIVLKCLEKKRERRYADAAGLVEDVRRHMEGLPILARVPSTAYLLQKLVAKHRVPFAMLASLAATLVGFSIWMGVLYGREASARGRAVQAETAAEERRRDAEREAANSKAVSEFLIDDLLGSGTPANARGRDITVREVVGNATRRIRDRFAEQPLVRASVLSMLGQVHRSLGRYRDAVAAFEEAETLHVQTSGESQLDLLRTRLDLVDGYIHLGLYERAESLAEATYDAMYTLLGPDDVDTLRAAAELGSAYWLRGRFPESLALHGYVLEHRKAVLGAEHPDTWHALVQRAVNEYLDLGDSEDAESTLRQALQIFRGSFGEDHPDTIRAMTQLGVSLARQRRFEEAEPFFAESFARSRRVMGEEHPETLAVMVHWAVMREQQVRLDEAEAFCNAAARVARRELGEDNPLTLWILDRFGHILGSRRRFEAGLRIHEEILNIYLQRGNEADPALANAYDGVGVLLYKLERYGQSVEAHRKALETYRVGTQGAVDGMWTLRCLVQALGANGQAEEARPFAVRLLELRRQVADAAEMDAYALNAYARELLTVVPADLRDPKLALEYAWKAFQVSGEDYHYNRYTLGLTYEALGDLSQGVYWLRRALDDTTIEVSEARADYEAALVRMLEALGDREAAENVYRATLSARRERFPADHPDVGEAIDSLGGLLLRHGNYAEAVDLLRESLSIRLGGDAEPDWRTDDAKSMLGAALAGLGRFEEAGVLADQALSRLIAEGSAPASVIEQARLRVEQVESLRGAADQADRFNGHDEPRHP